MADVCSGPNLRNPPAERSLMDRAILSDFRNVDSKRKIPGFLDWRDDPKLNRIFRSHGAERCHSAPLDWVSPAVIGSLSRQRKESGKPGRRGRLPKVTSPLSTRPASENRRSSIEAAARSRARRYPGRCASIFRPLSRTLML